MTMLVLLLIVGLGILSLGAEGLVRGSASLALRLGLPPLVIGLTVVAFGTSAPELVVSIGAVLNGQGNISVGNVVGSNILNIAVILGAAAVICPIKVNVAVLKLDVPIMILVSFISVFLVLDGNLSRGVGIFFVVGLVAYTWFNIHLAKGQHPVEVEEQFEEGLPKPSKTAWLDAGLLVGGLAMLIGGANLFVTAAVGIAQKLGVDEAVIGLTIVAAGTSMPELATSVVAALRKQPDIAVGNVIGSNIFNILGILGTTATVRPILAPGIRQMDLWVMLAFAIALLPLLYTKRELQRWEGLLLLGAYGAYLLSRWPTEV